MKEKITTSAVLTKINVIFPNLIRVESQTERTFTESETLKMLSALRQRCAEEAKVIYINSDNPYNAIVDAEVDKESVLSIDLTQFLQK